MASVVVCGTDRSQSLCSRALKEMDTGDRGLRMEGSWSVMVLVSLSVLIMFDFFFFFFLSTCLSLRLLPFSGKKKGKKKQQPGNLHVFCGT